MVEPLSAAAVSATTSLKEAVVTVGKETISETLKEGAEAAVKETPVQSMMSTIENNSLETLKAQNIVTINMRFEGLIHAESQVPYLRKSVLDANDKQINGVFPDFKHYRQFEVKLPDNLLQESDKNQFDYCNQKLKESYDKGNIDTDKYTERQIDQIKNGDKPEGFTWHHNESKGRMELVPTSIHESARHTGGKCIWGGGKEAR